MTQKKSIYSQLKSESFLQVRTWSFSGNVLHLYKKENGTFLLEANQNFYTFNFYFSDSPQNETLDAYYHLPFRLFVFSPCLGNANSTS